MAMSSFKIFFLHFSSYIFTIVISKISQVSRAQWILSRLEENLGVGIKKKNQTCKLNHETILNKTKIFIKIKMKTKLYVRTWFSSPSLFSFYKKNFVNCDLEQ
jgi:hypothetical protein